MAEQTTPSTTTAQNSGWSWGTIIIVGGSWLGGAVMCTIMYVMMNAMLTMQHAMVGMGQNMAQMSNDMRDMRHDMANMSVDMSDMNTNMDEMQMNIRDIQDAMSNDLDTMAKNVSIMTKDVSFMSSHVGIMAGNVVGMNSQMGQMVYDIHRGQSSFSSPMGYAQHDDTRAVTRCTCAGLLKAANVFKPCLRADCGLLRVLPLCRDCPHYCEFCPSANLAHRLQEGIIAKRILCCLSPIVL